LYDDCPYKKERDNRVSTLGGLLLTFGIAGSTIFTIAVVAWVLTNQATGLILAGLCGLPPLLLSMLFLIGGGILTFAVHERITNPASGEVGYRMSFGEREIYRRTTTPPGKLTLPSSRLDSLAAPLSVNAVLLHPPDRKPRSLIFWNKYAVELLITCLAGLLAQDVLEVRHITVSSTLFGKALNLKSGMEYFLVPGEELEMENVDGTLESKMVEITQSWPHHTAAKNWPQGLPLFHLGLGVLEKVRWNPGRWVYQQVINDAETRGLSPQGRRPEEPDRYPNLQREGEQIERFLQQLSENEPGFMTYLRNELRRALSIMELE
jgi:hypothetical protein